MGTFKCGQLQCQELWKVAISLSRKSSQINQSFWGRGGSQCTKIRRDFCDCSIVIFGGEGCDCAWPESENCEKDPAFMPIKWWNKRCDRRCCNCIDSHCSCTLRALDKKKQILRGTCLRLVFCDGQRLVIMPYEDLQNPLAREKPSLMAGWTCAILSVPWPKGRGKNKDDVGKWPQGSAMAWRSGERERPSNLRGKVGSCHERIALSALAVSRCLPSCNFAIWTRVRWHIIES